MPIDLAKCLKKHQLNRRVRQLAWFLVRPPGGHGSNFKGGHQIRPTTGREK
jgi:hypothetical protein